MAANCSWFCWPVPTELHGFSWILHTMMGSVFKCFPLSTETVHKHCTNSLNTKNVKTRISEIPSWILLDNNMRSWKLDCYKTKLCKEKKVWNLPLKKNTTQSWNHWVQTKTEHQRRPLGKSPKFRENQWKSVFWDNLCALFVSTLGAPSVLPNCLYWLECNL